MQPQHGHGYFFYLFFFWGGGNFFLLFKNALYTIKIVYFGKITVKNLSFNGKNNFLLKEYQKSRPGCVMYEHAL